MNYLNLLLALSVLGSSTVWASSELDSEINDLQVRIVRIQHKPKPRAKPKAIVQTPVSPKVYSYEAAAPKAQRTMVARPLYKTTPVVAVSAPQPRVQPAVQQPRIVPQQPTEDYSPSPQLTSHASPEQKNYEAKFVRRFELVPSFTASSFDGSDSSTLIPSGVSSPFTSSFLNAELRTDIDMGIAPFYLEVGAMISEIGSTTGAPASNLNYVNTGNLAYQEKVTLTYLSVPVNVKWRLAPEESSALYIKAGLIPAFMMAHNYQSSTPVNDEYRFGAYNTFDLQVDGGLGYDFRISKNFHALAEVSVFQGFMPVMTNYSVYNYGFITGLGLAYLL